MTRGINNERLPEWLQDFAELNEVTVDPNPELYEKNSIYKVKYRTDQLILEERSSGDEIAILLSGDAESMSKLTDLAGYRLEDRYPREVILE